MGLAWSGTVLTGGENLAIQGVRPAGIAAQGQVVWQAQVAPSQPLLTVTALGSFSSGYTLPLGMIFAVASPITVTALGRDLVNASDPNALNNLTLYLVNAAGTILGQVSVPPSPAVGTFVWANLASPVALAVGQNYGVVFDAGEYYRSVDTVTVPPGVLTYLDQAYIYGTPVGGAGTSLQSMGNPIQVNATVFGSINLQYR